MLFKLQNISFKFCNFALKNISFELQKGEILGIIGESGSGKTLLSLRILGLLDGVRESKGEIIFNGARVESMREFLGKEITYIPQEPLVALNPLHRIKKQVCEILELHNPKMPKNALDLRFAELMKMVDLDLKFGEVYPYELSGGQRQRVLMAIALANNPKIIIADEPTTALDSVLQKQILDSLRDLSAKLDIAVILITHNIAVVRHYADKILLLKNGEMVGKVANLDKSSLQGKSSVNNPSLRVSEANAAIHDSDSTIDCHDSASQNLAMTKNGADSAKSNKNAESNKKIAESHTAHDSQANNRSNGGVALRCFDAERAKIGLGDHSREVSYQNNENEYPRTNCLQNPYLRDLLNATHFSYKNPNLTDEILLKVQNLSVFHTAKKHLFGKNTTKKTLHNINFSLKKGEILGIIGESGSGKSTLALALLNLIKYDGDIIFGTQNYKEIRNFRAFRKHIQIVFQDPNSSLNARFRVREIIKEGLDIHYKNDSTKDKKVAEMLRFVGLDSSNLTRFPSELSGGQRQRIAIARALILNPQILILDEPTSALDKITQKQVLELLLRLKDEFGLSYILITHDLGIIRALCDSVIVLKNGEIAESGDKFMLESPKNPYTKSLVESIL
ncbi:ATP-binding cassette domain-containing protein [Helicobacter sp. 23-1044]